MTCILDTDLPVKTRKRMFHVSHYKVKSANMLHEHAMKSTFMNDICRALVI